MYIFNCLQPHNKDIPVTLVRMTAIAMPTPYLHVLPASKINLVLLKCEVSFLPYDIFISLFLLLFGGM